MKPNRRNCLVCLTGVALLLSLASGGARADAPGAGTLPKVTILATGGTIAGRANANSEVGYTSGQVSARDLIDAVPGIGKLATLGAEQISNIGSQDMNDEVWVTLARRINEIFAKGEADG